jgi:hypothetical protein
MRDEPRKPALRISHIVHGRINSDGRVLYLVDPRGLGDERAIPEEVVLRRWRRRRYLDLVFSGERLSPTVWRALRLALGPVPGVWPSLDLESLRARIAACAGELKERDLTVPAAETIRALIEACGPDRIALLMERHASPSHAGRSGVPDLFLFARDSRGSVRAARFVEVKKPDEPVSKDQEEELAFLIGLGLHARVLRLIERHHVRPAVSSAA